MDSLHSKIRDWKAREGGLLYYITKLDIELEGHRADCNEAGGTSCADQPTARYILHLEGTPYANISLGRCYVSSLTLISKINVPNMCSSKQRARKSSCRLLSDLTSRFVSEMQVLMKVVQLVPWQRGVG